jgi:hypothetical protein
MLGVLQEGKSEGRCGAHIVVGHCAEELRAVRIMPQDERMCRRALRGAVRAEEETMSRKPRFRVGQVVCEREGGRPLTIETRKLWPGGWYYTDKHERDASVQYRQNDLRPLTRREKGGKP